MAQRVLSISLGSEIVKICEVALAGKKKVQVFNAIDLVIPSGLCEDGFIVNAEALADSIKEGLKGEGFSSKKIAFTLASKRIASKEAIIPFCKENRIKQIVEINASEYFPISNLQDYTVSYSILDVIQNDNVKNYRLSVIAVPNELIEKYYELAKAMGMSIVSIDYAGNASLQLLKLQTVSKEVDAILQVGPENTVVNIMEGSTMVMQRSVPYGRSAILDAVEMDRDVPENVADLILIEEDVADLVNNGPNVADAVRAMFSSINRIIEFYSTRSAEKPIEHIYMIGDVVSINGLVDLFNSEWDHEVEYISKLHGIEIKNKKNVNDEIAANYIANIGAVIAPMNIELVEEKTGKKKLNGLPWWLLILSGAVSAVMVGGILFLYNSEKNECDDLQAQIAALGQVDDVADQYNAKKHEYDVIMNWYDSTKSPNESLAKFIEDLEKVQPKDLAIKKLTLNEGEVSIDGTAGSKPIVAQFLMGLKSLEYVDDVKASFVSETVEDLSFVESFTLSLRLRYEDPYGKSEETEDEIAENDVDTVDEEGGSDNE